VEYLRNILSLSLLISVFTLAAAARAQNNPIGQAAPEEFGPHQITDQDRLFAREIAIGGRAEVEDSRLATNKINASGPRKFADLMVQDHTKANDKLASLAKADDIALPDSLDPETRAMNRRLHDLSGAAFEQAYIDGQIADHQKTAQLLEWEIDSGKNPQLKQFAVENLPVVLQHLQMAQDLKAQMNGVAPSSSAP
jgi:putative membrane protein